MVNENNWYNLGKEHVWHPYTQEKTAPEPIKVVSTKGCTLTLENGTILIDGTSSWWSACHGYNHPHIANAIKKQLKQMPHFMFAGTAHEPGYLLAHKLCKFTKMDKAFFTDSGSTAVETAMKIAVQYWKNIDKKHQHRTKFITFTHSYHGDTMGCMSLCDPHTGMHKTFGSFMPMQYSVDIPSDEYRFAEFDELVNGIKDTVAGIIMEPLVQGAGGLKFHSADIVAEIYRICKKHDLLFIADEVMTGFGRTGEMFACFEAGIEPDIMCVGKALTSGTLTLAATLVKNEVFEAFLSDNLESALMSGPTFMANPLACSAALASLELFEKYDRLSQVNAIEKQLYEELAKCRKLPKVKDVRIKGAIGVVQIETCWEEIFKMRQKFIKLGVWLRPFGDVVYIMPPFTITKSQLSLLSDAVFTVLSKL